MKSMVITMAMLMATSTVTRAQDQVQVPKEALQEMGFLVGVWQAKGTIDGNEFSGTYTAEWAPGKHCLQLTIQYRGGINSDQSGIGGWSPDRKQYVEYWYGSEGSFRRQWYSFGREKGVWVGGATGVERDGKKLSAKTRLQKAGDAFSFSAPATGPAGEKHVLEIIFKKAK